MKEIFVDRTFRLTVILTVVYLATGFSFLHFGLADYGWAIFVLFPFSLGLFIGAMPLKKWAVIALVFVVLIFLILLYFSALEGLVCVLMAIPIVIPLVLVGVLVNRVLIKSRIVKNGNGPKVVSLPLIVILGFAPAERFVTAPGAAVIEVRSERIYAHSPKEVYDAIKSVDTLIAEKTFLMKLDLPVPYKCVLEREEVGGLRTCYFQGGTITERITELERGKILRMDVIDYQLTGRKWLGFREAVYFFEALDDGHCRLTRVTTYTSVLKPRFYWQPLEEMGIQQEHAYVLESLDRDLRTLSGKFYP